MCPRRETVGTLSLWPTRTNSKPLLLPDGETLLCGSSTEYDGWTVYYKITALDYAGNESPSASPGTATGIEANTIPTSFALHQNVPNPFNPATTIGYDVPPGGGVVTIRVYDVAGRLVRTLIDESQAAGQKTVRWNGTNDTGTRVASGMYFYRMTAPGFTETRKMVLLQ